MTKHLAKSSKTNPSDDAISQLLRNSNLEWELDDKLIDIIEKMAPPVSGEEEFRKRLLERFAKSVPSKESITLGRYVAVARGKSSLSDLAKRIGVAPAFLSDLETDRVGWDGLVRAFRPKWLAVLISELHLDAPRFIELMFAQRPAAEGPALSRTDRAITKGQRAQLHDQVQSSDQQGLNPNDSQIQRYLQEVHAELERLNQTKRSNTM